MFTTKYTKKPKKRVQKFGAGGTVKPPLKPGTPGTWSDLDQASGAGSGAETMPSAEERRRRRLMENAR